MASTLETMVNLQSDRNGVLKLMLQNYKKDSQTRKTRVYFKKRLTQVDELRIAFLDTHAEIINLDAYEESAYYVKNMLSDFDERYMDTYCILAEDYERLAPEVPAVSKEVADVADPELRITMPQMSVPRFSGVCVDWPGYFDAFTSLIHNNHNLSNVQRLHFLKESLPLDRDNDIRQMQLSDENYQVAWGMMFKRYNHPRLVFSHHMNTIYALPRLQKDSSESIRSMLSTVNVCLAAFRRVQALDGERHHWLTHYIASKLPKETHNAWEHHQGSNSTVPSFNELQSFLNDRLVIMDAIENRNSSFDSNNGQGLSDSTKRVRVHNAQDQQRRSNCICHHCGGEHILRRCPAFLALDAYKRKDIVSKAKLCSNCLSRSHALSRCNSNKGCQVCGQRHHTLLHFPSSSQAQSSNHPTPATQPENALQPTYPEQNSGITYSSYSAMSSGGKRRNIPLATARVTVRNPINGLHAVVNALR